MTINELRASTGMSQKAFGEYFGIPKRTIENWEGGQRKCPPYLLELMKYKLEKESKKAAAIAEQNFQTVMSDLAQGGIIKNNEEVKGNE